MSTQQNQLCKHTPAPWGIGEGGQHVYYVNPKIESGELGEDFNDPRHDSVIATCGGMGAFSGLDDEEIEANARLIAAAPDLLAACKLAREILENMPTKDFARGADRPVRDALDAAIAKAEGAA